MVIAKMAAAINAAIASEPVWLPSPGSLLAIVAPG